MGESFQIVKKISLDISLINEGLNDSVKKKKKISNLPFSHGKY